MKKLNSLKTVTIIVISSILLAGCTSSTENQATATNGVYTETVNAAEPTNATEINSPSGQTDGVVKTTAGLVQGTNNDGVYAYLGVPYAEATERFVPAGEVKPWNGVRMADTYGAMSPQGAILGMEANADETGTDNNCQNLNIWTPGIDNAQKRPVMVWLHGGGFSTGTANNAMNDGKNLSQSGDVVVVSVNHRLNVFGHLDLSAYDDKYKYSGNVGLTDIVAALEWIQNNIEAFGGDPDNVTVFGQSGGGAKVLSLMTSPYAKELFEKGVVQSGATETMGVTFSTKEESEALTERILDNLSITPDNIEELQNVPTRDLQDASGKALQDTANEYKIPAAFTDDYAMEWGPVVDGDYMPVSPVTEDGFADAGQDIPLLIGSNLNEWTTFVPASAHTNMTEEQRNAYAQAYPNEEASGAEKVDTFIRLPMLKIMSYKADQGGAPVYAYMFTWENGGTGSNHGAEIPFVFDNLTGGDDAAQKLAETVSQAWINFAKTGTPSAEDLPEWEAYTRENGATMILDTESELVHNHDKELMKLLEPDYMY
ncbi:carboxylesterase family protein [Paenibacillus sp. LMG 31459]|uniref:Carboxylic ester hydrolase n=1 Tax=Paenibacillus phytohabitans TaxID=2654978 RepID=A0ABX1Y976_9BACL|nr:carboxylesterase family protein [Paenibacillus phytohabitans]NOU77490.1 carboxylesterase family protein [Paenibacillus phytohabitans]